MTAGAARVPIVQEMTMRDIAPLFDGFLVDLWGVVHDGRLLFADAVDALQRLATAGKPVVFLTNTSRRAASVRGMLHDMGLAERLYTDVVTAGDLAYNLVTRDIGRRLYLIGAQPGDDWATASDLSHANSVADVELILAVGLAPTGSDRDDVLADLRTLSARQVSFICGNPDRYTTMGDVTVECVGVIAERYQLFGGPVCWCGKPDQRIFREAIGRLDGLAKARLCVIGDSLGTDVCGGLGAGLMTALVARNGWSSTEGAGISPHYVLPSFCW